ncbi:MAG: hypothetical protein AB7E72_09950 [Lysobacterales bacterium]
MAAMLVWRWQGSVGESAVAPGRDAQTSQSNTATDTSEVRTAQSTDTASKVATNPNSASTVRKEAAVALDAPALGYRASAAQRADDMARLVAADDLAPLLAEFKRRAAKGDADAAARMRDIYDECLGVHMAQVEATRDLNAQQSAFVLDLLPANAPLRQAALQIGGSRCGGIIPPGDKDSRTRQLVRLQRESLRLAADLGHPGARVRVQAEAPGYERDPRLRAQLRRREALLLLEEGTAEALMDLSAYASDRTPFRSESWILAACSQRYPCNEVATLRTLWCAELGMICGLTSWEDHIRQTSSAREWRLYQAERDQILALLQAGDLGALLLSDEAIGGGG